MEIDFTVAGDRDIAVRLERMPAIVHQRLVASITSLTERLLGQVRAREPRRTGRLQGETVDRITETADLVRGAVTVATGSGNEHGKAAAEEYGAHGAANVRAFSRSGHTPQGNPASQMVEAYTRRLNIVARRYLRDPLDEMRGAVHDEIERALERL